MRWPWQSWPLSQPHASQVGRRANKRVAIAIKGGTVVGAAVVSDNSGAANDSCNVTLDPHDTPDKKPRKYHSFRGNKKKSYAVVY